MASISLQYRSFHYHDTININYDDVAHTITYGQIIGQPVMSGLSAGTEIYHQTIGADHWSVRVQDNAPYAYVYHYVVSGIPEDIVIDSIVTTPAMNGNPGTITITAHGTGTLRYSIGGLADRQASNVFNRPSGTYWVIVSRTDDSYSVSANATIDQIADLQTNNQSINCTSNGADDGKIILAITNGSGNYHVEYEDGFEIDLVGPIVNSNTRSNLEPGTYNGTITDTITGQVVNFFFTIVEPPPVVVPDPPTEVFGSVFYFPFANSISFVIDSVLSCETPQALDNVLFYDQRFKGIERKKYYMRFNRCDKPVIQLNSDFQSNTIQLRQCDGTLVKDLSVVLKEQNVGKTQNTECFITADAGHADRSRVYFNTSAIPVPVSINDSFNISNNTDGYNGNYLVVDLNIDTLLGKQYIVINKPYVLGVASTNATATFSVQLVDFNVYEAIVDFLDVPDGYYYFTAQGSATNQVTATSEPLWLKQEHDDTIKIECRHRKNGHGGLTWSTGYTAMYRVEGHWGNLRLPGGDVVINRNADNSANLVDSKPTRPVTVSLVMLPPYIFEKLGIAFKSHFQSINGIEVTATENISDVEYRPRTLFGSATVKTEQKNWFGRFTNTGLGTIVDGGYITTETGFLKR